MDSSGPLARFGADFARFGVPFGFGFGFVRFAVDLVRDSFVLIEGRWQTRLGSQRRCPRNRLDGAAAAPASASMGKHP